MTTASDAHATMRRLPIAGIRRITDGLPALILAPHPDDEVLGCAGLILHSLAAGIVPTIVFVTDGTGSHPRSRKFPPSVLTELRACEARRAAARLGLPLCQLHFLGCRDTAAPHHGPAFDAVVERIIALAAAAGAGVIVAPWQFDPHCDHLATHLMAVAAGRRTGLRHVSYPVWGWMLPDRQDLGTLTLTGSRLPLGTLLARKRQALEAHASQFAGIIDDDPEGFQLQVEHIDRLMQPFEVFLENP